MENSDILLRSMDGMDSDAEYSTGGGRKYRH